MKTPEQRKTVMHDGRECLVTDVLQREAAILEWYRSILPEIAEKGKHVDPDGDSYTLADVQHNLGRAIDAMWNVAEVTR